MNIPVFVSCPTDLSPSQELARKVVHHYLEEGQLEPRALGRSDYPLDLPLREVFGIARHCAGGVILGFEQFRSTLGVSKPGSSKEEKIDGDYSFPTPWNHLEAGILYGLKLPLLIFREQGVTGGIFDTGVTDVFTHQMPEYVSDQGLKEVFRKWEVRVRNKYYEE